MKKWIALMMSTCLVLMLVAGCGPLGSGDERGGRTGEEIAKLLLADQRLKEDVFEEKLNLTASEGTVKSVASKDKVVAEPLSYFTAGTFVPLGSKSTDGYAAYSNMYSYFESYMTSISETAHRAAENIAHAKELTFTDVWIEDGGVGENGRMLLSVEAGTETLLLDNDVYTFVCHRYNDDNANDVYEMIQYEKTSDVDTSVYMLYSTDQRYEFALKQGEDNLFVVVEKDRGYWNMFTLYSLEDNRYNVQNLVVSDSFALVYYGTISASGYNYEWSTFIDPQLTCDLVDVQGGTINLNVGAFNGISSLEINSDNHITAFTANGTRIDDTTVFSDPDVRFHSGADFQVADDVPYAKLGFVCEGEYTQSQVLTKVLSVLPTIGVSSRYDLAAVERNVDAAMAIATSFDTYYDWNGYTLGSLTNVDAAIQQEEAKRQNLYNKYEQMKDNKTVAQDSRGFNFKGFAFATISSLTSGTVVFENNSVRVEQLNLQITQLDVMDEGAEYTVHLALARLNDTAAANNKPTTVFRRGEFRIDDVVPLSGTVDADYTGAVIMDISTAAISTVYEGGSTFSVSQSASFALPKGTDTGTYTVVAYVATAQGIRVSEMVPIPFSADVSYTGISDRGYQMELYLNNHEELIALYHSEIRTVRPETEQASYTYAEVKEILDACILKYGIPLSDSVITVYDPKIDTTITADEAGVYQDCVCGMSYQGDDGVEYLYLLLGNVTI